MLLKLKSIRPYNENDYPFKHEYVKTYQLNGKSNYHVLKMPPVFYLKDVIDNLPWLDYKKAEYDLDAGELIFN